MCVHAQIFDKRIPSMTFLYVSLNVLPWKTKYKFKLLVHYKLQMMRNCLILVLVGGLCLPEQVSRVPRTCHLSSTSVLELPFCHCVVSQCCLFNKGNEMVAFSGDMAADKILCKSSLHTENVLKYSTAVCLAEFFA